MDILPPKAPATPGASSTDTPPPPAPAPDPYPVAAPVTDQPDKPEKPEKPDVFKLQKPPTTKLPKTHGSGMGLAIVATVIIVLGLGALMVYAYLRTKGISIP